VLYLFCNGVMGFSHHFGGHGKCDVLMFGNEKKDIMRCFCFLFSIFCSFLLHRKKPSCLFAGQLFLVPGPGRAERSLLYVSSICWASVFFQICSIVMVMVTISAGVFVVGLSPVAKPNGGDGGCCVPY